MLECCPIGTIWRKSYMLALWVVDLWHYFIQ
jgi:hypothetical protein